MVYHHITAYSLTGLNGASLPSDIPLVETTRDDLSVRAVLTGAPDRYLDLADRGLAIRHRLARMMAAGEQRDLPDEIASIRAKRSRRYSGNAALVIEIIGSVEFDANARIADLGEFMVAIRGVDKESLRVQSQSTVNAITAAVSLASGRSDAVERFSDDVYLLDEAGKVVYSVTSSGSARLQVMGPCTEEMAALAAKYAEALVREVGLARVCRLLVQSLNETADGLRAFLSAWNALEVLTNVTFKAVYKPMLADWWSQPQPLPDEYLPSATQVNENKCSLRDKFNTMSHFLAGASSEEDRGCFRALKCTRDNVMHGEDVDEGSLPLDAAQRLVIRYLAAHLLR